MFRLALAALPVLAGLSSVHAQTPSSDFISGSPVLLSAFPSATAALYNNANARDAPTGKVFKYFVQVWLENEAFRSVDELPQYEVIAEQGIVLTNYNGITHPSQPNYIAAVAGSDFGIVDDDYYDIPANETTIFDLLENKGLTWKAYNEDIPASGWTGFSYHNGSYVRKHNPAISFDSIGLNQTRSANVVPGNFFKVDIENNNVPAYSFYTPNITNDGHDTNGSFAGTWLDGFFQSTLANATFMKDALVLITFDEDGYYAERNQIWSCLIGGVIPAELRNTTDDTFYTHYSALHTVELNWGLGSLNRGDANVTLSNVFQFAAPALNYTNVDVTNIPLMNDTTPGMLTGDGYNATHTPSASGSTVTSGAIGVACLSAVAALITASAILVPYFF